MIEHRNDGWYVVSKKTKRNLGGPYSDKGKAQKRLGQVEAIIQGKKSK